jgi:hypothetical protein
MAAFVLGLHAQRQAHRRGIDYDDIDYVLDNYESRRPARRVPGRLASEMFVAAVGDSRLRV